MARRPLPAPLKPLPARAPDRMTDLLPLAFSSRVERAAAATEAPAALDAPADAAIFASLLGAAQMALQAPPALAPVPEEAATATPVLQERGSAADTDVPGSLEEEASADKQPVALEEPAPCPSFGADEDQPMATRAETQPEAFRAEDSDSRPMQVETREVALEKEHAAVPVNRTAPTHAVDRAAPQERATVQPVHSAAGEKPAAASAQGSPSAQSPIRSPQFEGPPTAPQARQAAGEVTAADGTAGEKQTPVVADEDQPMATRAETQPEAFRAEDSDSRQMQVETRKVALETVDLTVPANRTAATHAVDRAAPQERATVQPVHSASGEKPAAASAQGSLSAQSPIRSPQFEGPPTAPQARQAAGIVTAADGAAGGKKTPVVAEESANVATPMPTTTSGPVPRYSRAPEAGERASEAQAASHPFARSAAPLKAAKIPSPTAAGVAPLAGDKPAARLSETAAAEAEATPTLQAAEPSPGEVAPAQKEAKAQTFPDAPSILAASDRDLPPGEADRSLRADSVLSDSDTTLGPRSTTFRTTTTHPASDLPKLPAAPDAAKAAEATSLVSPTIDQHAAAAPPAAPHHSPNGTNVPDSIAPATCGVVDTAAEQPGLASGVSTRRAKEDATAKDRMVEEETGTDDHFIAADEADTTIKSTERKGIVRQQAHTDESARATGNSARPAASPLALEVEEAVAGKRPDQANQVNAGGQKQIGATEDAPGSAVDRVGSEALSDWTADASAYSATDEAAPPHEVASGHDLKPSAAHLEPAARVAAEAAWVRSMIARNRHSVGMADGWNVFEMKMDEGGSSVTVKSKRTEERVSVSVSFSDPNLRALVQSDANKIEEMLAARYDSAVDLSFSSDGGSAERGHQQEAAGAGPTQHKSQKRPALSSPSPRTTRSRSRHDWIG